MAFLGQLPGKSTLGNRIGSDLAEGLQGLAQHKLQQKQSHELEKIGFPKQLASIFHTLDPKVQEGIWKQVNLSNIGQLQQQGQQAIQAQQPQMQPTFTPEQTEFIKSIPSPLDRQKVAQQFQMQNQQQQQAPISSQPSQQFGQAAAQQQIAQQLQPQSIFQGNAGNGIAEQNLLEKQKSNAFKQQQVLTEQQEKIEKKFEPIVNQFAVESETASKMEPIIEELNTLNEKIEEEGTNWGPMAESAVGGIHKATGGLVDLRSLAGKEIERFRKLSAELLNIGTSGVKGVATNFKVMNLEKALPSLAQSYEGRKEILQDLEKLAASKKLGLAETEKIREENGGNLPRDFREKIFPRIDKERKQLLNSLSSKQPVLEFDTLEEAQAAAKQYGAKAIEDTSTKKKIKA